MLVGCGGVQIPRKQPALLRNLARRQRTLVRSCAPRAALFLPTRLPSAVVYILLCKNQYVDNFQLHHDVLQLLLFQVTAASVSAGVALHLLKTS